jgi:hypothetical protein
MTDSPQLSWEFDDSGGLTRRPAALVELPLTRPQQRWWDLCTRFPGGSSPVVFLVHRLRGPLVVDAWVRAVSAVVDRHETLRTRFVLRPDGPVQVVDPPAGLAIEMIDLTHLPPDERLDRAHEVIDERRRLVPELIEGQLVSSCLVGLAADDHVWTLTIHHITADGVSLGIIDHDLSAFYHAFLEGSTPLLPDLPVQFGDYAWAEATRPQDYAEERVYWVRQLAGVPPLELPSKRPRPAEKGAPAAEVSRLIAADLAQRLDELAKSQRSSQFMVLLAGLAVLLGWLSDQVDFCIGTPVVGTGRLRDELAMVVGLFANTLGLRMNLSGDPPFEEVLARARNTVLDAVDQQDLPFAQVIEDLRLPYEPDRAQLFQVLFILDEFDPVGGVRLPDLTVEEFPVAVPKTLHDMMVYVWSTPDGLTTRFVFDSALFDTKSVTDWAEGFERLLRAVVQRPDIRLSELAQTLRG